MLCNNIREARDAKGWTQQELAERIGVTQQAIQRYETGARDIRASVLIRLSKALGVRVAYLLSMTSEDISLPDTIETPVYSDIPAGKIPEVANVESIYPLSTDICSRWPCASYLLHIRDDSMDRTLPVGCYALVEPLAKVSPAHLDLLDNQICIVCAGDSEGTIGRLRKTLRGFELVPESSNPSRRVQAFSDSDLEEGIVAITARIVWHFMP